jgi:cobalamin biosynthetic protein CobC
MPEHGGKLLAAAHKYGISPSEWIDLSTGINPNCWPVPHIPNQVFQRLPEVEDGLLDAAKKYYGSPFVLPVAGSQAAINILPGLRSPGKVGILSPTYSEHGHVWANHGHSVVALSANDLPAASNELDVLIVCNPNNPTGYFFQSEALLECALNLAKHHGWLIVDEAFMDATPHLSMATHVGQDGLIILRSFGKFFGLSGLRLGFVLAGEAVLLRLANRLGPWAVNGPARWLGQLALNDRDWHMTARSFLTTQSQRLGDLLSKSGLNAQGSTAFFQWVTFAQAADLHNFLARQGILTRLFSDPLSLRFGLPKDESQCSRLAQVLVEYAPILDRQGQPAMRL